MKKQYNGLLYGKSSQNKAYGAVQYEKYDLLYGEDYDYNKSSILIVANNNYDIQMKIMMIFILYLSNSMKVLVLLK